MSVNKYDSTTGTLTSLASGARTWIGTKAAYDAEKLAGTLPTNCLIVITDDEEAMDTVPTEDSPVAVTSDGIYNALIKNTNDSVGIPSTDTHYSGTVWYEIKGGWCHFRCDLACISPVTNSDYNTGIILPKPQLATNIHFWALSWWDTSAVPIGIYIKINTGELCLKYGTASKNGYVIDGTYPV